MNRLQDKVAVLTGGTRGLGLAMAKAFMDEGASVVVGSRSKDSVERAVKELKSSGGKAGGLVCNVDDFRQVQALADHAEELFGRIDIWVNNAGLSCPTGPTAHIPHELVRTLIKTNILGVYHGSTAAIRRFVNHGSGKLINISGKGEKKAFPLHNAYASSKAWEHNFTMALAKEYKDSGIGIYLLNPGVVDSDMIRHLNFIKGYEQNIKIFQMVMGMLAKPPEAAVEKAVWLASAATDGRTGLRISLVGPGVMLKGMLRAAGRKIIGRKSEPIDVEVSLVEPEIQISNFSARKKKYIVPMRGKKLPVSIGNKAKSLHFLMKKKYLIPETYVCSWEAREDYESGLSGVLSRLQVELNNIIDDAGVYAVRSSANLEDSLEYSFAGQFDTILNVRGVKDILSSIQKIWATVQSESVNSYLKKIGKNPEDVKMAVIIQKMIKPVYSGVVFSKNPINALDEVLVEAVEGSGTTLVQGGVTPYRWVNKWGGWIEQPDEDVIPQDIIQEVVDRTKTIKKMTKEEVDLEWVYDGRDIYWLQLRSITSIKKLRVYSSRMAKEMTPGMIHPLVWSVVVPIPSRIWADMIEEVAGKIDLDVNNLAKSFHYRTYHNLSEFGKVFAKLGMPDESLEMMMGVIPAGAGKAPFKPSPRVIRLLPHILRVLINRWTFAKKLNNNYPRLYQRAQQFSLSHSKDLDDVQLMTIIDGIKQLNKDMMYYTINAILLMQIYTGIFKSRLKKAGIDFEDFDLTEGMDELKHFDLTNHLDRLNQFYLGLDEAVRQEIRQSNFETFMLLQGIDDFQREVKDFIDRFGHMSDTTGHFGSIPWRETPDIILDMIIKHEKRGAKEEKKIRWEDLKKSRKASKFLHFLYKRCRQFSLFREMFSSLYTYTLMLFRVYYLAVGDRLAVRGLIESREDIYFLMDEEIRSYIAGKNRGDDFAGLVKKRCRDMDLCKDAVLPEIIFGDAVPPIIQEFRTKLTGRATAKGYTTAQVKIVHGLSDLSKLKSGDVLVIPYSDVSWTPLFAKAGAVVAESGGMLSHSSIIAREYNIPAVVSVKGCLQLQDCTLVTVDGFKGEVLIHQNPISNPKRTDMGG